MLVLRDVSYTATQHEFLSKERINKTDYGQYSLAMDWNNDRWDVEAMAGYSGAEKTLDYSNLKHVAYAPSRTRWTGRSGETIPSASSAGFDMYGSPERYLFEAYETTLEKIDDDKYAAKLDVTRKLDLPFLSALRSVQFGGRYTDRRKERQYGELKITGPGPGDTSWVNTRTLADSPLQAIGDIVPGGAYSVKDLDWRQVSNDFARAKLGSRFCRSRAVTSHAAVTPSTPWRQASAFARRRRCRTTTAISPSNSTRELSGGSTTGVRVPTTDPGDFRKITGSAGTGLSSSRACSR